MAAFDPAKALALAHAIPDAWYRAQALSCVARHVQRSSVLRILSEAVAAAYGCNDAYNTVAVMSWPLEASWRARPSRIRHARTRKVLLLAPEVEPRASRAFALQCLWGGCYAADEEFAEPVWQAIRTLCNPDHHWRAARLFRHIAEAREQRRPGSAVEVIAAMPIGKARAALERRFKVT